MKLMMRGKTLSSTRLNEYSRYGYDQREEMLVGVLRSKGETKHQSQITFTGMPTVQRVLLQYLPSICLFLL